MKSVVMASMFTASPSDSFKKETNISINSLAIFFTLSLTKYKDKRLLATD